MTKHKTIIAADLFCGAGGTSTGLIRACEKHGAKVDLTAINHWNIAIDTHSSNHPGVKHLCKSVHCVDPRSVVPAGYLDLLWASPECTHFSRARGGKPRNDQSRASAFDILNWLEDLHVENVIIENVPDFLDWGPLGADGQPLKSKKGTLFHAFIQSVKALNYVVEWRVLICANYGDPTTRERLFIIGRRGRKKIKWPEPSHLPPDQCKDLFASGYKPWRTAREIINWEKKGRSVFSRKKPLSPNTMRRIWAGFMKFGGSAFIVPQFSEHPPRTVDKPIGTVTSTSRGVGLCQPYLVHMKGTKKRQLENTARSVDKPLPTINAGGGHIATVEPYLVTVNHGQGDKRRSHSLNKPLPTLTTKNGLAVVEPYIIGQQSGSAPRSTKEPLPTVAGAGAIALVEPYIIGAGGPAHGGEPQSVDRPIKTILGRQTKAIVQPYLVQTDQTGSNGKCVRSVDKPIGTVVTKQNVALVQPFIVSQFGERNGQQPRTHSVDAPLPAVTSHGAGAVVQPFLTKYYKTGASKSVDAPIDTITTNDRFALVQPYIAGQNGERYYVDFLFRMLDTDELARGQGFPDDYKFAGTKSETTMQIGNAVPCHTAEALCSAVLNS